MEEDLFILKEDILEINLHDMQETEAEYFLDKFITTAPSNIKQINVIHGYKKGQVLLNMVRTKLKHPRITKNVIPFNKGVTIIYLN